MKQQLLETANRHNRRTQRKIQKVEEGINWHHDGTKSTNRMNHHMGEQQIHRGEEAKNLQHQGIHSTPLCCNEKYKKQQKWIWHQANVCKPRINYDIQMIMKYTQ